MEFLIVIYYLKIIICLVILLYTNMADNDNPAGNTQDAALVGEVAPTIVVDNITTNTPIADTAIDYSDPTHIEFFTIPANKTLYHGTTTVSRFNPHNINLGNDTLVAFFTPNKHFAAAYIGDCLGGNSGWIHEFRTTKPIDNIYILSSHEIKNWDPKKIELTFCGATGTREIRRRLNGVGFFVPKTFGTTLGNSHNALEGFDAEFALCDPSQYLQYVSTSECISARKMNNYVFT